MIAIILWTLLTLILSVIVSLIAYARWNYGKLEKLGIPVVKPHFFLGSDPKAHLVVGQHVDYERYKKLGPVFGIYEGRTPKIYICDPEMIRLVLVKDFDHFQDRTPIEMGHELYNELLDFLPGEKWKTMRSILTPMFTSSRLKQSMKLIQELSNEYMLDLKNTFTGSRIKFSMRNFVQTAIIDLTGRTFLAIQLPDRKNPNNFLVQLMKAVLFEDLEPNFFFTLIPAFPFLTKMFDFGFSGGAEKFIKTIDEIMDQRRKSGANLNDFIDAMIAVMDKVNSPDYKRLGITDMTIKSQAVEMFLAGYDSVISSLSILTYFLAKNPKVQEKLLDEIDQVSKKNNGEINYDTLEELPFLSDCIKEAIRLSPAFPRIERLCTKTWSHEGLTIEKGTGIIIPSWATNRNSDVFPDPEAFKPERWTKDNNKQDVSQYAFTSFGYGPRACLGVRFALIITKSVMFGILKDFKIENRPDTKAELMKGLGVLSRYGPIEVDLVKRNNSDN